MTEDTELQLCLSSCYYLKLSLMWPLKGEKPDSKWFYFRLILGVFATILTFAAPVLMHLIEAMEEGMDISEDLGIFAAIIGLVTMMVLYVVKQKDLSSLLQDLSNFEKFGKPPNFDKVNKRLDFLVKFVFSYAIFGAVVYNLMRIIEIPHCKRNRKIREVCGVFVPLWTPFDADYPPVLVLVAAVVFIVVILIDKVTLLVSLQVLEISCHIRLRIEQLNAMILNCFNGDLQSSRKRLNDCVQYHIDIISYSERFNNCFTNGMFIHLATTGIIIGCLENQNVEGATPGGVLHLFGWIISLFTSCLAGQILLDSSTSVADALYNSQWYTADVKLRKNLILMIQRSQKPLFLATGAFNIMSFALFVTVMKMSYSILTLLQ